MKGKIPIIDLSPLVDSITGEISSDSEKLKKVSQEVSYALENIGFMYLINHGIPNVVIKNAFTESKIFFESPTEEKMKCKKNVIESYSGYTYPGTEVLNVNSKFECREAYDLITGGKRFFPNDNFKKALLDLESYFLKMTKTLLKIFAIALNVDEDFFMNCCKFLDDKNVKSLTTLRTNYYPPIDESLIKDFDPQHVFRCAEHSDYGILTFLFQDSLGGLQVRTANNEWEEATPIPDSILVNTGDLIQFWSSGKFLATKHRVLVPEEELKKRISRQSVAYFIHPDNETIVTPLHPSPNDKQPESISAYDHAMKLLQFSYGVDAPIDYKK